MKDTDKVKELLENLSPKPLPPEFRRKILSTAYQKQRKFQVIIPVLQKVFFICVVLGVMALVFDTVITNSENKHIAAMMDGFQASEVMIEKDLQEIAVELFEIEYVKHLQTLYEDKVVHEGFSGEPDAYVLIEALNELHIFSLKKIATNYLPRKEISPEQEYAFENRSKFKKIRLFIIALINNKIHVQEETNFGASGNITF